MHKAHHEERELVAGFSRFFIPAISLLCFLRYANAVSITVGQCCQAFYYSVFGTFA